MEEQFPEVSLWGFPIRVEVYENAFYSEEFLQSLSDDLQDYVRIIRIIKRYVFGPKWIGSESNLQDCKNRLNSWIRPEDESRQFGRFGSYVQDIVSLRLKVLESIEYGEAHPGEEVPFFGRHPRDRFNVISGELCHVVWRAVEWAFQFLTDDVNAERLRSAGYPLVTSSYRRADIVGGIGNLHAALDSLLVEFQLFCDRKSDWQKVKLVSRSAIEVIGSLPRQSAQNEVASTCPNFLPDATAAYGAGYGMLNNDVVTELDGVVAAWQIIGSESRHWANKISGYLMRGTTLRESPNREQLEQDIKGWTSKLAKVMDRLSCKFLSPTWLAAWAEEESEAPKPLAAAEEVLGSSSATEVQLPDDSKNLPTPGVKDSDEKLIAMKKLLNVFTNGVSDDRFTVAAMALANSELKVDEKLNLIDEQLKIPVTVSAAKLAKLIGVTAQAVKQSPWWTRNRKGEKADMTGRRVLLHKERSKTQESQQ